MKEPREWDEDYILTGLPIGEFDWFEAKGSNVLKPETKYINSDVLSKALSAFANSGGGTLVLGLKQDGKIWQVDDGGIAAQVGRASTKEWLEDIIPHLVELPLQIFNVYEAKRNPADSQIDPEKAIFVIEIGDSTAAPHQATDKFYYGRIAGKSKPLSHRFILDILGRRQNPKIELTFEITKKYQTQKIQGFTTPQKYVRHLLDITAHNIGRVYVQYLAICLYVPKPLILKTLNSQEIFVTRDDQREYWESSYTNLVIDFIDPLSDRHGVGRYAPVLPGLKHSWSYSLSNDYDYQKLSVSDQIIHWEVYADNAPPDTDSVALKDIKFMDNVG